MKKMRGYGRVQEFHDDDDLFNEQMDISGVGKQANEQDIESMTILGTGKQLNEEDEEFLNQIFNS